MRVSWSRPALAQLDDIQDYIAQDSRAAAHRLALDLTGRTERVLADNPMMGRTGRARGTRELVFADMPYIVVYRVTDRVEILAVMHAARKWPERFD
jgi:toxin ParE1/3/4